MRKNIFWNLLSLILIIYSGAFAQEKNLNDNQVSFLEKLLPGIDAANESILKHRAQIENIRDQFKEKGTIDNSREVFLSGVAKHYAVNSFTLDDQKDKDALTQEIGDLLMRVDIIPDKLVMAQAIIESGWGKSTFSKEGNNYFGVHCYSKGCGMIPKGAPNAGFEVKSYPTVLDAITDYIHILNTCAAYEKLRETRAELRSSGREISAMKLAEGLSRYSQKGSEYITLIHEVITEYLPSDVQEFLKNNKN